MSYDEDISCNPIFQLLAAKFPNILTDAPSKSFLICIPKNAIAQEIHADMQEGDLLNYVMRPVNTSPGSGVKVYHTLTKKRIDVKGMSLYLRHGFSQSRTVGILFEETFYNQQDKSYPVICVDQPFEGKTTTQVILQQDELLDPMECYKFLLLGGGANPVPLENFIQMELSNFSHPSRFRQGVSLRHMLDVISGVITRLVRVCIKYSSVHRKYCQDKSYIDILRLAVENVVYFEIYPKLFKVVCGLVSKEDGELNKMTRNLAHIDSSDLDIKSQFCFNFPKAQRELDRMKSLFTPYQKLCCLNQTIKMLSQPTPHSNEPLNADDLLPLLMLLIIHSDIPCWYGSISYMESFYLSPLDKEKHKYCLSSVEAAVEFIRSGNLKVDRSKRVWLIQGSPSMQRRDPTPDCRIDDFFELILNENFSKLQETLDSVQNSHLQRLCHPLCACQDCRTHLSSSHRNLGAVTLSSCDDWGRTPLHVAAIVGNERVLELLLNYGAQANSQDYHGSSPLHMACQRGHIKCTMILVDRGAPTNLLDNSGNTPLHLASHYGHEACVKALVYQSPARKLNPYNEKGDTPLHLAARWGYEDIVVLLLEFGASWEARNKEKELPLDCTQNSAIQSVFKDFILRTKDTGFHKPENNRKVLVKRSSTFTCSPMAFRRSNNAYRTSTALQLKKNHLIENEMALVFDAITAGKERVVREMLGWGGEEGSLTESICVDNRVCHPLCKCRKCTAEQITETQLNVAMASKSGQTFLHVACLHGNYTLSKLFINKGADVNTRTYTHKHTPLHLSAQYNHRDVVKLLLDNRAEINARDINGCTPLHYCATNGHTESAETLLNNGASPNEANLRENIPLHSAAKWGHGMMVQCLLSHGSIVDKFNADNLMPIQMTQSDEVVSILEAAQSSQTQLRIRSVSIVSNDSDKNSSMASSILRSSPSSVHDSSPQAAASESPPGRVNTPMQYRPTGPQFNSQLKTEAEVGSTLLTADSTTLLT